MLGESAQGVVISHVTYYTVHTVSSGMSHVNSAHAYFLSTRGCDVLRHHLRYTAFIYVESHRLLRHVPREFRPHVLPQHRQVEQLELSVPGGFDNHFRGVLASGGVLAEVDHLRYLVGPAHIDEMPKIRKKNKNRYQMTVGRLKTKKGGGGWRSMLIS